MLAPKEYDDSRLKAMLRGILETWRAGSPNRVLVIGDGAMWAKSEFKSPSCFTSIKEVPSGFFELIVMDWCNEWREVASKAATGGLVIAVGHVQCRLDDEALKYFYPLEASCERELLPPSLVNIAIQEQPNLVVLKRNNIPASMVCGDGNGEDSDNSPFISRVSQTVFSREMLKVSLSDGFYLAEETLSSWSCWFARKGQLYIETSREGLVRFCCKVSPFRMPSGILELSIGDETVLNRKLYKEDRIETCIAVIPGGNPIRITYDGALVSPNQLGNSQDERLLGVLFSNFHAEFLA